MKIYSKNAKFKRRRQTFEHRMKTIIEIPNEIKEKYTKKCLEDEYSLPTILQLDKTECNSKLITLKDEIDEIVNELEYFQRETRKKRIIRLMEVIADNFDENSFDVDELMDFYFFGDRQCNIENQYIDSEKNKFLKANNFCEYTNKLLMDDDEIFLRRKSASEN